MKMRNTLVAATFVLGTGALGACAGRTPAPDDNVINATGAVEYSGSFRPIQQATGAVGMTQQQRIYGNVRILFREMNGRANVNLTISTNGANSELLGWAVLNGRCGSGAIPVSPVSQFPPIQMGATGRGEVSISNFALVMPAGATYHVNVYRGGDTLADVIACSTLSSK